MRLFCYGTLLFPEIMQRVTGNRYEGFAASLDDYGCYTVKGRLFPGIVHEQAAVTQGVVYGSIGENCLRRLDRYEGELYERVRVCVTDTRGRPLQAWTYVIDQSRRHMLTDRPWDRQGFERAHLGAYLRAIRPGGEA